MASAPHGVTANAAWHGNEQLRPLLVPIAELQPHPKNPRRGNFEEIARSLDRFGQQRPILALPDGTIVAGRHTWGAALEHLRWSHIAVVRSDLTDDEVMGYLLADNRTAELGGYDDDLLIEALTDQYERGKLAGTGWTPDDYDDLLAQANKVAETAFEEFTGDYAEDPEDTEARANRMPRTENPENVRQVVVMLGEDRFRLFANYVRTLSREYGTTGSTDTIFRAVEAEFKRAWSGKSEEERAAAAAADTDPGEPLDD